MKKIVLTGGGTAGHVTPNIALIPELKKEGYEIYYIGSHNGIERKLRNMEFLIMEYLQENLDGILILKIFQIHSEC